MADEWPHLIASDLIDVPHGFLTGPQSDRREFARAVGAVPIAFLQQVHSPDVVTVDEAVPEDTGPEADAMVSNRRGIALAIKTADCVPVLFADESAGVIGAAHAGWRGAQGGVLENTVAAMIALGADASHITAAIGPAIAQESYEVDEALRTRFASEDSRFFAEGRAGHYQFDLPEYVAWRLAMAGVGMTDSLCIDTYANPVDFHSYRRATHQGVPTEGRQYSLIALAE